MAGGYWTGIVGKLHVNPADTFPFDYARIPEPNFDGAIPISDYVASARVCWGQSDGSPDI